jgi:acetyl-CoA carboxylase biotin carboxyl carrier protein
MAASIDERTGLLTRERISSLMDLMQARGVVAFRLRQGDEEIEIRWPEPERARAASLEPSAFEEPSPAPAQSYHAVTSPTVGTYFASSEPGKPAFVKLGQRVTAGQVLCVVESMKLMNEIEADVGGVIVELPIPNGGSVKAGEVVCLIRLEEQG